MNEDMLNVMGSFISTELDAFENLHKELEEKEAILGGIQQLEAEIERLHSIIKEAKDFINGKDLKEKEYRFAEDFDFVKLLEILGDDKS